MKKYGLTLGLFMTLLLVGCNQQKDYDYYMLHPEAIPSDYAQCVEQTGETSNGVTAHCQIVEKARVQVSQMLQMAARNGQEFGKDILNNQIALAQAQDDLKNLQHSGSADDSALQQAQQKVKGLEFKVNSQLAVLKLLGP